MPGAPRVSKIGARDRWVAGGASRGETGAGGVGQDATSIRTSSIPWITEDLAPALGAMGLFSAAQMALMSFFPSDMVMALCAQEDAPLWTFPSGDVEYDAAGIDLKDSDAGARTRS